MVVESCAEFIPELEEPRTSQPPIPGTFGSHYPATSFDRIYTGCGDNQKWCFRLERYTEEHALGVDSLSRLDIQGTHDPLVTPDQCELIISDLTPTGQPGEGPPRTTYWSSAITLAHEEFHAMDYSLRVTQPIFNDLVKFVSDPSNCTQCTRPIPWSTFDEELKRLDRNYPEDFYIGHEERAHAASNPLYDELTEGIRQRARSAPASEAWPEACK